MDKRFKNPNKKYNDFKTAPRPFSPSPNTNNFENIVLKESDKHSKCIYISPDTNKRCKNNLGIYPRFCHIHTTLIENVYISKSNIEKAGKGLFSGPYGFEKGDIIGEYSMPWMKVKAKRLDTRSKTPILHYVYCKGDDDDDECWDALDLRTTMMRYANDNGYKNNAYFKEMNGGVFIIASKKILPNKEIFLGYGSDYWGKKKI